MAYGIYRSKLAKLLASENITVEHIPGAKTASFDLKNRTLNLPIWNDVSPDLYDMFIVHEVGHALDTPANGWHETLDRMAEKVFGSNLTEDEMKVAKRKAHAYLNVVEDVRIDRRQKIRYPGSKANYNVGLKEIHERDFFGLSKINKPVDDFPFIDRANIFYKGGDQLGIKFTDDEKVYLDKMFKTETWEDVVKLVEEIFNFVHSQGDNSDSDMDMEDIEFEVPVSAMSIQGLGGTPDGFTQEAYERSLQKIVDDTVLGNEVIYCNIPNPILDKIIVPYTKVMDDANRFLQKMKGQAISTPMEGTKNGAEYFAAERQRFDDWRSAEKASISYMIKEFETFKAASAYSKIQVSKTGVVDVNRLHSYLYSDDIFKRNTIVPQGKNHGFVFFIDWSSSMTSYIHATLKQMYSIMLFCRRQNIPFDVYAFTSGYQSSPQFKYEHGDLILGESISCRHLLSSKMSVADLQDMMFYFWLITSNTQGLLYQDQPNRMAGTPLNAQIIAATDIITEFRKKYRIEIMNAVFLTDGDSNPASGVSGKNINFSEVYKMYLRDKSSKDTYVINGKKKSRAQKQEEKYYSEYARFSQKVTETLYTHLKNKTNANIIGFHLLSGTAQEVTTAYMPSIDNGNVDVCKSLWVNEGFMPIKNAGFDEKYLVSIDNLFTKKKELSVNGNMSLEVVSEQFNNYMSKRRINRVLLRRFIENISKEIV